MLLNPSKYHVLVAEVDGEIVGYAIGYNRVIPEREIEILADYFPDIPFHTIGKEQDSNPLFYSALSFVSPEYRRRGIGKQLETSLIDLAKDKGSPLIFSILTQGNEASRAVNSFLGYRGISFENARLNILPL